MTRAVRCSLRQHFGQLRAVCAGRLRSVLRGVFGDRRLPNQRLAVPGRTAGAFPPVLRQAWPGRKDPGAVLAVSHPCNLVPLGIV